MLPWASGVPGWKPEHCLEAGWKGGRNQVYKATESRTLDVGAHTDNSTVEPGSGHGSGCL
jgi:hypothetical protein